MADAQPQPPASGDVKRSLNIVIMLLLFIIICLVAGSVTYMVMNNKQPEVKVVAVRPTPEPGPTKPLGEFILNLADEGDPPRYIKMSVTLELKKEDKEVKKGGGAGAPTEEATLMRNELKARDSQLKDIVVSTVSAKTSKDLMTLEGREMLKKELKEKMSAVLTTTEVVNVYFETFAIQ